MAKPGSERTAHLMWRVLASVFTVKRQGDNTTRDALKTTKTAASRARPEPSANGAFSANKRASPADPDDEPLDDVQAADLADDAETDADDLEVAALGAIEPSPEAVEPRLRGEVPGSLAQYSRAVRAVVPIDAEEELRLVAAAHAGDTAARHRLIECHLGIVIAVARGYSRLQMPIEDLIEEGNLGLMEAVDRFDPSRGVRFASYARWWIRESINNAMTTQSRTVRLPSHIVRSISAVMKAQRRLEGGAGNVASSETAPSARMPAVEVAGTRMAHRSPAARVRLADLADATGRPSANVAHLIALSQSPLSLNATVDNAGESGLQETLAGEDVHEPDTALLSKETLATVLSLVDRLPKVERAVVIQRFGFGAGEPRTLEEVGASVGLTAERVRQLQVQAVGRLREMLTSRGIDLSQFL